MTILGRLGLIAALAAVTAGCAGGPVGFVAVGPVLPIEPLLPLSDDAAYPVYGNPVNPTPVPGYRVECSTYVGGTLLLLNGTTSGCRQILVPPAPVISVSG